MSITPNNNMLYKILGEDADASKYVSRYKSNRSTGSILVGVGTVLFFTGTAVAVANKASEDVWSATTGEEKSHSAGGIILIVLGVTLDISGIAVMADSKNILKQGVRVYNSNHRISSFNKIEFHLITGGNGLGIRMKF